MAKRKNDPLYGLWRRFTVHDAPAEPTITIYLKSPHAISGDYLKGTVVISPIVHIDQLQLHLIGSEIIYDATRFQPNTHIHTFLQVPCHILDDEPRPNETCVPFVVPLPLAMSTSYKDKKCQIQYQLRCRATCRDDRVLEAVRVVPIYQSVASFHASGSTPLHQPICDKRNAWDRPSSGLYSPISGSMPTGASPVHGVDVTITLAKHMWVAGALMYVDMTLENQSMHTIEDIHIELIRRQNTFANMRRGHPFGLMPVTSSCESIAATSLHEKGWWQPIAPNCKDHVTIPLDIPAHAFTIKLQKLVDISFAVRVAIRSHASKDDLAEIPIVIAHKVATQHHPVFVDKELPSLASSLSAGSCASNEYLPFVPQRTSFTPPIARKRMPPVKHDSSASSTAAAVAAPVSPSSTATTSLSAALSTASCSSFSSSGTVPNSLAITPAAEASSSIPRRQSNSKFHRWMKRNWVEKHVVRATATSPTTNIHGNANTECVGGHAMTKSARPKMIRACESFLSHTKTSLLSSSASLSILLDKTKKIKAASSSRVHAAPNPLAHKQHRVTRSNASHLSAFTAPSQKFELTVQDLDLYSQWYV